ncbi:MAG: hypothetical protein JWO36_5156 [Myxococcales bacterium]|nr:hypothetical protein [Myxococcales bacterium]
MVSWQGSKFVLAGLPAVAHAGEIAVVAVEDSDGGRGFPNLRLEVRDRTDNVIQKMPVMISNEYETLAPDGKPGPTLTKRIADVNRELATLHGVHDLQPMHTLELQATTDAADKHLAIGDSLDVDWSGDHLHVFPHNTDKPVATVSIGPWLVHDIKRAPATLACSNPAYLSNAYHATDISLLVVEVGYHGTDTCWEPGKQLHVVTW